MSNRTKLCYSMYCPSGSIPFYTALMIIIAGILSGFFFDYILLLIRDIYGSFPELCLFGFHIHHLYIGLLIVLVSGILFAVIKNIKVRIVIIYFFALGFGLALSDIISHLTVDPIFEIYC